MKCPKCGYTSFDYLDICKKCSHGLSEFKSKYGLRSLLFPNRQHQRTAPPGGGSAAPAMAVAAVAATAAAAPAPATSDSLDFGHDFMSDGPAQKTTAPVKAPAPATDHFDFDADWNESPPPATAAPVASAKADSFDFDADWSESPPAAPAAPVAPTQADSFDFDADWSDNGAAAPSTGGAEEDTFDFQADTPEPMATAIVGEENLDLDLGTEEPLLEVATEEPDLAFNPAWDEEPAPTAEPQAAAGLEDFTADSFQFAAEPQDDGLSFDDEFDFSDDELPDLLATDSQSKPSSKKPGAQEGPADPFEQRESAQAGPAPAVTAPETLAAGESPAAKIDEPPLAAEMTVASADPVEDVPPPHPISEPNFGAPAALEADAELPLELPEEELSEEALAAAPLAPPAGAAGTPFFRMGASALDILLLALVFALFLAAGKLALFPADQAVAPLPLAAMADLAIPYFLILFALCFGYFTLFHFLSGQTPGKMLFRLKVESASGDSLQFAQAFLRSVGGLLCLVCGGVGYLLMLRDPQYRGWNDRLAGTRVVATAPLTRGE